jgi:hypothetical protein
MAIDKTNKKQKIDPSKIDPSELLEMTSGERQECRDAITDKGNGNIVAGVDDPVRLGKRISELRDMGFWDVPSIPGARSSVRVYAEATLLFEDGLLDKPDGPYKPDEPCIFVTLNKVMLARADELHARFKVLPLGPQDAAKRMQNDKDCRISLTETTLNEAAEFMYRQLCADLGVSELSSVVKQSVLSDAKKYLIEQIAGTKAE